MAEIKLTERRIAELVPPTDKDYERYWDTEVVGLCVKVMRSGRKVYNFKDRLNGKPIWGKQLPKCSETTLADMRHDAIQWKAQIRRGENPWHREEEITSPTVYELCRENLEHKRRQRNPKPLAKTTLRFYEKLVEEVQRSRFGAMKADEVSGNDAARFLGKFSDKARYHDGLKFFLSNSFRNCSVDLVNHFDRMAKRYALPAPNRLPRFSDDDIRKLAHFLGKAERQETKHRYSKVWIQFVRFLIHVGARPTDALKIEREWIDQVDGQTVVWHPTTKTGFAPILLSASAVAIISETPRVDGNPYIFPGQQGHLKTYAKNFARLSQEANLPYRCPYAIRRWFARTGRVAFNGDIAPVKDLQNWDSENIALRYAGEDAEILQSIVAERATTCNVISERIDGVVGSQLPNSYHDDHKTSIEHTETPNPDKTQNRLSPKDTQRYKGSNGGSAGGIRTPDQLINSQSEKGGSNAKSP